MTLKSQIAADVSAVFQNTDEHAETWQHWPRGNSIIAASAVVVPEIPASKGAGTEKDTSRGDEQVGELSIYVDADLTLHAKDAWKDENGNVYQTISNGPVEAGLRRVELQRNDKEHTRRHESGSLL